MAWWRHEEGSTSSIGFAIAAGTFAIAFSAANVLVAEPAGMDHRSPQLDTRAAAALDLIVSQAGRTESGGAWADAPDLLDRFGLTGEGTENFLDYRKIKAMRNASMAHETNNAPDYVDVREALGLTEGDFHLRTYPVIPDLDDPRWTKDPRGRVAYVGHFDSARGYATATGSASTAGETLNVSVSVRNDGADPQIFIVAIGIGNRAGDDVIATDDRHTRLLASGETQVVWATFPKMAYSPALTGARISVTDAYGTTAVARYWIDATAPTGTNVPWAPLMTAGRTYYQTGEDVKFLGDHFEGDGSRINENAGQAAKFVLFNPDGTERVNQSVTLPKNGVYTYTCTTCTVAGTYRAVLWDSLIKRNATDIVHVSATALFQGGETLAAVGVREVNILKSLVENFNGETFNGATHREGDVFSDSSHIRELADVLSRYTLLVIGSEVKQTSLNAGDTKWAIADWVQDGGNLVVLGTLESQSRWLDPVYHAAQETANGGIGAPDPTHPVLSSPNQIDYKRYLDNGRAWRIKDDQPFTHILTRGAAGNSHDDTLAVAEPGAYNDGTVVLTSYMAGALTDPQDDAEAMRFMHNLLSQSYNMLFLDYGPAIPEGVAVGSAQRLAAVPHPNVPNAVVEVRIVMYTWSE